MLMKQVTIAVLTPSCRAVAMVESKLAVTVRWRNFEEAEHGCGEQWGHRGISGENGSGGRV
jgi:hypothetical protein